MTRYLVHVETTYYPWAEVVEAESPESAPDAMENGRPSGINVFAVAPLDQVTFIGDKTFIEGIE